MTIPFKIAHKHGRKQQRGAALVVSMIMILLVLLLAVVAMRSVTLESRITANMLENQRLYEVADGTLREGERMLLAHAFPLAKCESTTTPVTGKIPCYVSEAKTDTLKYATDFTSISAKASDMAKPQAYWYPRYITATRPKGDSATSALDVATVGSTEFYEINAQATEKDAAQTCGPDALCLRSSINMFIK